MKANKRIRDLRRIPRTNIQRYTDSKDSNANVTASELNNPNVKVRLRTK